MTINYAINGLGRIGRLIIRSQLEQASKYQALKLSAANGPAAPSQHAHLLKYDSVYGPMAQSITAGDSKLVIENQEIPLTHHRQLTDLRWPNVDVVLECTGKFNNKTQAQEHLNNGASRVLVSAPCKEADFTAVYGVNHDQIPTSAKVISAGSCTTNCLAPLAQTVDQSFGIESGFMTTIHAMTGDQNLTDGSHKNLRRARAASMSMIPTSTGAAKTIGLVLPELAGKLDGAAIRVPTANVSAIDLCVNLKKSITLANAIDAFKAAAVSSNVMDICEEPLVSTDFNHTTASCIIDLSETRVIGNNMLRVLAWYDNEYAFACRMLDLCQHLGKL